MRPCQLRAGSATTGEHTASQPRGWTGAADEFFVDELLAMPSFGPHELPGTFGRLRFGKPELANVEAAVGRLSSDQPTSGWRKLLGAMHAKLDSPTNKAPQGSRS